MRELNITLPGRDRPRRLRRSQAVRDLVAETHLSPNQFVLPHFVLPTDGAEEPVSAMPGISCMGVERLLPQVESDLALGIRSVLLFGQPSPGTKAPDGRAAADDAGAVQRAVKRLKDVFGDELVVMTDVCLCAYTDHGHCGLIEGGDVDNDLSLRPLVATALSHARAGADIVAPSDMMDGRVGAIRDALDADGHQGVAILAYTAKYASAYYGPFREAADSAPSAGDRQGYQMDCRNALEAIREAELDEQEGADMLMVKPALPYLDVISAMRSATAKPLAAYNVSGEYSAVKAAAERGWLEEARVVRENLLAIARAGADLIITYHCRDALREKWL